MTKSQIGQASGNDVLERSRPCRVAHVHSFKVAMGCTYVPTTFPFVLYAKKSLVANVDKDDPKSQTEHLL